MKMYKKLLTQKP